MPWAIFHKPFDYDFRPVKAVCQHVEPSDRPQEFVTPLIAAAVAAGCAEKVAAPNAAAKRSLKRRVKP